MRVKSTLAMTASVLWSLLVFSCSTSSHVAFDKVKLGLEKTDVLELIGSPNRTRRWKGLDEWTYVYYQGNKPIEKEIRFEEGRVVAVQNANGQDSIVQKLKSTTKRKDLAPPLREDPAQAHDSGFHDLNDDDDSETNTK